MMMTMVKDCTMKTVAAWVDLDDAVNENNHDEDEENAEWKL